MLTFIMVIYLLKMKKFFAIKMVVIRNIISLMEEKMFSDGILKAIPLPLIHNLIQIILTQEEKITLRFLILMGNVTKRN